MAVTVVQILSKQRLTLDEYQIGVRGERADEPTSPYTRIVVEHRLRGAGLTRSNLERLVTMVEERYCSVAASLAPDIVTEITLTLNGESFPPVRQQVWTPRP